MIPDTPSANPEQIHSIFSTSDDDIRNTSVESFFTTYKDAKDDDEPFLVNKRPHLTQFLEKYHERFDFDIFTAALD